MYSTTYTANHHHIRRAPARSFVVHAPKTKLNIRKLLLIVFLLNVALVGAIYAQLYMFPQAKYSETSIGHEMSLGPVTESFVKELKTEHFSAIPTASVKRLPLSVQGRMISIDGDNIQVFEYDNAEVAQKEAYALVSQYENADKNSASSEKNEHIYLKDKLVIFYLGSDESIMNLISKDSYQSMEGISLNSNLEGQVSAVSKTGSYYK